MGLLRILLGDRKCDRCQRSKPTCICDRPGRTASGRKFSGRQVTPRTVRGGKARGAGQYVRPMGKPKWA